MSMIYILIEIKLDIDVNNDGLLIIIWEHNKKETCHWYCITQVVEYKWVESNSIMSQ
jgi:hypothetical protein